MDPIQQFLNEQITNKRYTPTVEDAKRIAKKYYRKHLKDVMKQFKKNLKDTPWMKPFDDVKFFDVSKDIPRLVLDTDESEEQTEQYMYVFSTYPSMDSDALPKIKRDGVASWKPVLDVDIISKNNGRVYITMISICGFVNADGDYNYPGYVTKILDGKKIK